MEANQQNLIIDADSQYIINGKMIIANNLGVSSIDIRVTGINKLECNGNKLTRLPDNIDEIEDIGCDNNEITELPDVANMDLNVLSCENNKITKLPLYISKLEQLYIANNPLEKTNFLSVLAFGVNYGSIYDKMDDNGQIDDYEDGINNLSLLTISIDQMMLLVAEKNNKIYLLTYFDTFMKRSDTQIHIVDTLKDLQDMNTLKKYNQILNVLLKKYNNNPNQELLQRRIVVDAPNFKSRIESVKGLWESGRNSDISTILEKEPETKEDPPAIPSDIGKTVQTFLGGKKSRKYKKKSKKSKRGNTNKKRTKRYRKRR
jgi:hypothetical protein